MSRPIKWHALRPGGREGMDIGRTRWLMYTNAQQPTLSLMQFKRRHCWLLEPG